MKINEFINIKEAAEILGVTPHTLRKWEKDGKIKVYRNPMNKFRMYKKEELEQFLQDIERQILK